jgi:putative component of toxin-antitoxin plasmid stabilization module
MVDDRLRRDQDDLVPAIFTTPIFDAWFVKLRDRTAAARVQAPIDRLEMGVPG